MPPQFSNSCSSCSSSRGACNNGISFAQRTTKEKACPTARCAVTRRAHVSPKLAGPKRSQTITPFCSWPSAAQLGRRHRLREDEQEGCYCRRRRRRFRCRLPDLREEEQEPQEPAHQEEHCCRCHCRHPRRPEQEQGEAETEDERARVRKLRCLVSTHQKNNKTYGRRSCGTRINGSSTCCSFSSSCSRTFLCGSQPVDVRNHFWTSTARHLAPNWTVSSLHSDKNKRHNEMSQ
jgi:hypothetical protein